MSFGTLIIEQISSGPESETMAIRGVVDENADLTPLSNIKSKTIILDLSGIERINSMGVQSWIRAMTAFGDEHEVWWEKVSTPMVMQVNMIANFNGGSRIRSFYAPYYCKSCDTEHRFLLEIETDFSDRKPKAPQFNCPKCENTLEFDDVEEDYLGTLLEAIKEVGQ